MGDIKRPWRGAVILLLCGCGFAAGWYGGKQQHTKAVADDYARWIEALETLEQANQQLQRRNADLKSLTDAQNGLLARQSVKLIEQQQTITLLDSHWQDLARRLRAQRKDD